jgi:hypothetical protein
MTKKTVRVRRGLREVLALAEGWICDAVYEDVDAKRRADIELAMQWLREQAAEREEQRP